ncbi:DUF2231 domain-containing protein [Micromonospora inyonensis]|uniref:DUF2231 domain-containing protein n=1 Tax=Micromonospora inyonensis TaxID=47866 RepID=A0A1C6RMG4_9ACTN|nr:DUF2231 domain-containing protein [Micromonospora inyonensis]SCL18366.1 hypothetical protein GA0074694_2327 [Micromonospora inyonensis]
MFETVAGLPVHVLVVHAVVVFVPLLALLAVAYGVLPRWRDRLGWAVGVLAVVTPVVAWVATESGEAFENMLRDGGYPPEILSQVETHSGYGDLLFRATLGLAVAAVALLLVTSGRARARSLPSWLPVVLTVVVVALAVLAMAYVYLTGETGARAVWDGVA